MRLVGIAYFFAGLAKLRAGPAWFTAPNLEYLFYHYWLLKGVPHGLRVDQLPALMRLLAVGTVAFELSFIVLVLFRRTRVLAFFGGLAFHGGTYLLLRIWFEELMACYSMLVDWHGTWRILASRLGWQAAAAAPGSGSAHRSHVQRRGCP